MVDILDVAGLVVLAIARESKVLEHEDVVLRIQLAEEALGHWRLHARRRVAFLVKHRHRTEDVGVNLNVVKEL